MTDDPRAVVLDTLTQLRAQLDRYRATMVRLEAKRFDVWVHASQLDVPIRNFELAAASGVSPVEVSRALNALKPADRPRRRRVTGRVVMARLRPPETRLFEEIVGDLEHAWALEQYEEDAAERLLARMRASKTGAVSIDEQEGQQIILLLDLAETWVPPLERDEKRRRRLERLRRKAAGVPPEPRFATWRPDGPDASHRCDGVCGLELRYKRFPIRYPGDGTLRGTECRECREARRARRP